MRRALALCVAVPMSSSCLISPPIEAEPPEPNRPPYLDFIQPVDPVRTVNDTEPVTFSVRAFDENRHDQLFYVWVGESLFPREGVAALETVDELGEGELFYSYDVIERTIDPCGPDLEDVSRETVWIYVSDRDLDIQGQNVVAEPDGFVASFTWVMNITPGVCP